MEYQDLYRKEDGAYVGRHIRGKMIPKGTYLHLVSVFTLNSKREILLTQRDPKKSHPLAWENTGGAVQAGETLRQAAKRELLEETGIDVAEEDLVYLGHLTVRREQNALMHSFFIQRDVPRSAIRLQEGETVDAKWVPFEWSLCFDTSLAEPVRLRLIYFWQELQSFLDPMQSKDPHLVEADRYEPWLTWAKQLQFYAQQGQAYTKDPFDRERFDAISAMACDMIARKTGISPLKVPGLFAPVDNLYRTPNVEVRVAVFRGDKILMVQEKRPEDAWSLPGGWCDPGLTPMENAKKEVWEEAGIRVRPTRLIALEDRAHEDYHYKFPLDVYKIFILAEELEPGTDAFQENIEITDARFFALDDLPKLSEARVSVRAIRQCFAAKDDPHWNVYFD